MTIVRNRAIDAARRESATHRPRLADREPSDEVIARSEAEALRLRLSDLPDDQAEVIALAYYGPLSHSEIAARLALPPGTVKGRMRLGLEKLRAQLESAAAVPVSSPAAAPATGRRSGARSPTRRGS